MLAVIVGAWVKQRSWFELGESNLERVKPQINLFGGKMLVPLEKRRHFWPCHFFDHVHPLVI